jgi:hypothetical protein
MNRGITLRALITATVLAAPPAAAQQQETACPAQRGSLAQGAFGGFKKTIPLPPCAELSLPPITAPPTAAREPSIHPPPAGPREIPDHQVASTDLGFERGIGPALGRGVTWRGRTYIVVEVTTPDGRPTFAGGSRFIVTTEGGVLEIGLKALTKGANEPEMADPAVVN